MSNFEQFKSYLLTLVGPNWIAKISDKELYEFFRWISDCQTFKRKEEDGRYMDNPGNAFRGFVIGLQLERSGLVKPAPTNPVDETESSGV
jgi:hypothetical protein